jgi:hypothetical protein
MVLVLSDPGCRMMRVWTMEEEEEEEKEEATKKLEKTWHRKNRRKNQESKRVEYRKKGNIEEEEEEEEERRIHEMPHKTLQVMRHCLQSAWYFCEFRNQIFQQKYSP